ncbi:MAG: glutamate--tRNA ligase [Candidatus Omnitrophica bacterium]|nr:glutamate--tRNA ligase [Candidatus Omnitrophota bacterium]
MSDIRVRFAPSPTGYLHIGGVRTALFNYLYARQQGGKFLLRIEDTDAKRSTPEFEREILDSLRWLGLQWDEEVMRQSARLDRYREVARELVAKDLAYEHEGAVKFKIPETTVKVYDAVRGEVAYDSKEFEDLVILKSDGYPTFHLAVVVDDHDMNVTHVIRGEDHLPNTPRHILLYAALGWKTPKYAHLPLIFGTDGTPLSKRHGAVAASEYRARGFLPQALLNYLALLGWNPGTPQEIFGLPELIKQFSLKRVIKSNAQFNPEKLLWLNGQHLRAIPAEVYESLITAFWKERMELPPEATWRKMTALYRPRLQVFGDLKDQASYYFSDVKYADHDTVCAIRNQPALMKLLKDWGEGMNALPDFEEVAALDQRTRRLAEQAGMQPKDLIHPLRFILTGLSSSPGIFEVMSLLGKDVCLDRLKKFLG